MESILRLFLDENVTLSIFRPMSCFRIWVVPFLWRLACHWQCFLNSLNWWLTLLFSTFENPTNLMKNQTRLKIKPWLKETCNQSNCINELCLRVRPRFFDQVGHETMDASSGNKHFFTKSCHRQTYQNYEQSRQKLGTILENKVS